jgi:beta-lactamase superfamily II metal-dependent hydrolase
MILNRYEDSGAGLYRSDYQGAVKIDFLKDKTIQINAWRQNQPRYWQQKYTAKY